MSTVPKPRLVWGVCVLALLGVPTACSDDDTASTSPTSTTPATTGPSDDLPEGVRLTEAGATVDIGDPATAVYDDGERRSVLTVRVTKVVKGSIKDFKSFVLGPRERASTPYYVSASVTDEGPSPLGQTTVPLFGLDSTGTAFPATSLVGSFDRCPGGPLPTGFAPGDTVRTCLVYLVPPEATLRSVQLRTDDTTDPISWPVD